MKLTSRTPVIWQPDEMTCYGVQPKNVNAVRARDDFFSRTVLIADRMRKL